jgi:hypothetical protein
MQRLLRILIALDVFVFALVTLGGAKRSETISAASWSLELDGKLQGRIARPVIDALFYFMQQNHCRVVFDVEQARHNAIKGMP